MVSYTSSSYTTDFFDLSGVYFNSTTQSSGSSSVDLDELDKRYLLKAGGNISNNLVVDGSLDVKTALTLPIIGDVEDAIDGKQRAITNTIIVNVGDNLKDTINNMGVNDTLKVSGGTFTDNISITTASGTRTQGNVVGEENKTILSGNLTIRNGELFSLTNFKITGNTYVNNNTIFLPVEPITQSFTNCEFKLIEIRGGDMTLTFTDCKIKNNFRSLIASITGIIHFIICDFTGSSFNLLHSNKASIVMTDCIGLPVDVGLDTQNYIVKGITGYTTKLGAFLSHSYTANETPTLTNELTSKSYVDSQVGTKQDSINDGDLTIAKTAQLQTALDDKQDEIISTTDLILNSITTSVLNTSGRVGFDTTNIQFNTLVLRRPTGNDKIILNEIQVWVNDVNIMVQPTNNLFGYFADWDTDKDTPIPALDFEGVIRSVDKVYNNIIENNNDFGAHSVSGNALIIKDIPLTNINDIQSIVYYNRNGEDRSIGLVLELYNIDNDEDLIYPLASSNVITTESLRYRFDFPSISTYSLGFANGSNTEKIVNDNIALTETISLSNIEMTGSISMNNDLSVGGSLFLGDTNLTEDIDKLLTLDTNKRLTINGLTSGFVKTGEVNSDYLNTTFQGKFGIPDSGNDLTLSGTQINFNSDSFISNSAGGMSGNHLVIFVNGTEYKIKLENAS